MWDNRAGDGVGEGTENRLEPAVVAELYSQHADDLRAFLRGVLKNGDRAAEALQATFAKVIETGHTAQEETVRGWLFRVAFHEAMNLRRRAEIDERTLRSSAWSRPREQEADDRVIREEDVGRVREVLQTLPQEQQQVVRMRMYDDRTFAEIADELNLPLGTVLSRMRLAMKKIQDRLRQP